MIGAFKLNLIAKAPTVTAVVEILRAKKSIQANGNTNISTARSKFGGSSAYFDGASDNLVVKENFSFPNGSDFTIEFWVNEDIIQNAKYIAGQTAGDIFIGHDTAVYSNRLGVGIVNVGWYADFGMTLAADTWYHVAISRSGTNVYYFVDGVLKLTQTSGTLTTAEWKFSGMTLGSELTTYNTPLNGYIDEVRVSKTARYTAAFTPTTVPFTNDDNTVLLLHMDGTNATTFFEDDNGAVGRTPKNITYAGNAQISTAQSKFGGSSAKFDGTGDYLSIGSDAFATVPWTGDFTWEAWVYLANTSADMALFEGQGNNNLFIRRTSANKLGLGRQLVAFDNTSTGDAVTANTWTHLAVVRSGSTLKMYSNGTEIYSGSNSQTYTLNGGCQIGGSGGSAYVNGYIDEMRFSNSARYTSAFTPSTTVFTNDSNTLLLMHFNGYNASLEHFIDDAGRRAKSVISINGAALSSTQSKFGGTSAFFDGTNDYLTVNQMEDLFGDFTLETWFYSTGSGTAGDGIFSNDQGSLGAYRFAVYYEPGNSRIGWFLNNSTAIYSNTTMSVNTWYHIAFVRSGSTVKLYVNGVAQTNTSSYTDFLGYKTNWKIGNTAGSYFQGYMDEVRWSNTARYTANFTAPTTPFVNDANTLLLLHMDGTSASTVFRDDNGGRSQKGIVALGNAQISTAQSKFGGSSALFDGTGDYISLYNANDVIGLNNASSLTIEYWIRIGSLTSVDNNAGTSNALFNGGATNSTVTWSFGPLRTGNVVFWAQTPSYQPFTTSGVTLTTNTWYHLALTIDNLAVKIYVDGTQRASGTLSAIPTVNLGAGLVIGQHNNFSFNGNIDELRVSNTARYTANFTPSTTPFQNDVNTLLLLHMDGTNASTVFIDDNGQIPKTA